jgi:type II secretory pathway pseudopilin PulG
MPVLIEIVLAVAVVALVISYLMRGRREAERQDAIERRVEAYMQTIRREGGSSELAQMTDVELKDLLLSSARNLRLQMERKWYLLLGRRVLRRDPCRDPGWCAGLRHNGAAGRPGAVRDQRVHLPQGQGAAGGTWDRRGAAAG